ncbi:unnamed protein product, partial [Mesorhabditis belari]|uniref:Vang-like protein n=1 Tax=Mesorhabditis belari TaxID=2138241 RepID=A0AAF3F316_9BILA
MSVICERTARSKFGPGSYGPGRESGRLSSRGPRQMKRYAHSEIGEPLFIPHFMAIASEGVKPHLPADEWGENTTVLTGATSDISYGIDEKRVYELPHARVAARRCSRMMWLTVAGIISLFAVLSPPIMSLLPQILPWFGYEWPTIVCEVDCQGKLTLMAVESLLLVAALWALYWRRAAADLPRLYFPRAALTFAVLFILFAFWLFYSVRIIMERYSNYTYIVSFSLSLLDALLYTHYISLIVLYIRQMRPEFTITVTRDPDGHSSSITVGMMSIQEAAIQVLRHYETDFPTFNSYLDKVRQSAVKNSIPGQNTGGFKVYDLEGIGAGENISQANSRALLTAMARRRLGGYKEMLQEEMEWDRRLKKRKYRLIAAAEDAFSHVQGIQGNNMNAGNVLGEPMDTTNAVHHVFSMIVKPLNKYLRLTRQQPRYPTEKVMNYIGKCLSLRLNYRTFLSYFLSDKTPISEIIGEEKWSIVSEEECSRSLASGSTFLLRSHNRDETAGVQLICSISSLPFFNLTEQNRAQISKFAIKLNSESPV